VVRRHCRCRHTPPSRMTWKVEPLQFIWRCLLASASRSSVGSRHHQPPPSSRITWEVEPLRLYSEWFVHFGGQVRLSSHIALRCWRSPPSRITWEAEPVRFVRNGLPASAGRSFNRLLLPPRASIFQDGLGDGLDAPCSLVYIICIV
jgi:hypothetical protein